MPTYVTRKDNTYYFRQAVPAELRPFIGRREIKRSLGRDFTRAVRESKRVAVEADAMLAEARTRLDSLPVDPYSREGIRRTRHVPLTSLTPEVERQCCVLVRESHLENDRNTRIDGLDAEAFAEHGQLIEDSLKALRQQLARGNVEPMLETARIVLVGRGYTPELSDQEWRRLAYAITQATLEAYELMAKRQAGGIVSPSNEERLPSQFELQNAPKAAPAPLADSPVTWQQLYDVWDRECTRPQPTRDAYLATMKLFIEFCPAPPTRVTREDALGFRDFILQVHKRAPGTASNKVGFLGTIINAGRNNAEYARYLTHNPFERIKIKRPKRGTADEKRLPFSDGDLKTIFGSRIYTEGYRPRGGGGEAAAWVPAIAYLTGIRLDQIARLHRRQFHVDAQGNPYIHTEDGKNENSTDRDVPIHPMLVEAGLLDYVNSCSGRLFPKVRCASSVQSKAYSQWWGRYLTKLGITASSKVFHSCRHLRRPPRIE